MISFVGAITSPSSKGHHLHFSLVTHFCKNGSLFDYLIAKKRKLPLVILLRMARDIAAGILVGPPLPSLYCSSSHFCIFQHLHRENVIHRDIATRNILVGEHYGECASLNGGITNPRLLFYSAVYLSDFGLARVKEKEVNTTLATVGPVKALLPIQLTQPLTFSSHQHSGWHQNASCTNNILRLLMHTRMV